MRSIGVALQDKKRAYHWNTYSHAWHDEKTLQDKKEHMLYYLWYPYLDTPTRERATQSQKLQKLKTLTRIMQSIERKLIKDPTHLASTLE